MARTRASAKKAGTAFETAVCDYLKEKTGFPIMRMPKSGAVDKGDIFGVQFQGKNVTIECKNPGEKSRWSLSGWWNETITEIDNFDAYCGVLMIRKFRKPLEQSYCIFNEEQAQLIGINHEELPVTRVKGNSKWKDLVVDDTIMKFPMVGNDDHWIVMTLENFSSYIDRKTEAPLIEMTLSDAQKLVEKREYLGHTADGKEIMIKVI